MSDLSTQSKRNPGSYAIMIFPLLFCIVFVMHFRSGSDFFHFRLHYVQHDPTQTVTSLVRAQNHWPMVHDPHILGYLGLPFLLLSAYLLYRVSRGARPRMSAVAMFVTAAGTIYLGGVFGMWTAFFRGLGEVDPKYLDGAIATFKGMTEPQGAFLLTTTLAKLSMIGLAAQSLILWGLPKVSRAAVVMIVLGCALFLAFWDLDNWMLIGMMLIVGGFVGLMPVLNRVDEKTL
jgi:hypothetical protein